MTIRPLIRELQTSDLESAHELMKACFVTPWSMSLLAQELTHPWSRSLIATSSDDKLIGLGIFWLISDHLEVLNLATHPQFRRQGVAKSLLTAALGWAREGGAIQASLEVRASNVDAIILYRTMGFHEVARREKYYADNGEDAVVMRLETEMP